MPSRHVAALFAALLFAPVALAQTPQEAPPETPAETPAPDPLCDGLDRALDAAAAELPFISLVPAGQSLSTLPRMQKKPAGFSDFDSCQIYRAGNAKQGVNGGGPYNYFRCSALFLSSKPDNKEDAAKAGETYDALAMRVAACLTPDEWTASGGERTRKYEDYETVRTFSRDGAVNDVIVSLNEDNSSPGSRSKTIFWSVYVTVRNPNPTHPRQ